MSYIFVKVSPLFAKTHFAGFKITGRNKYQVEIKKKGQIKTKWKISMVGSYFKDLEVVCDSGIGVATAESLAVRILVLTSCGFCISYHLSKMQAPRLAPKVRAVG